MLNKIASFIIIVCLSMSYGSFSLFSDLHQLNKKSWRNDLVFLAKNLAKVHENLFFKLTKAEYRKIVTKAYFSISNTDPYHNWVQMAKVLSAVKDSQTWLDLSQPGLALHYLPIQLYWFDDGVKIINTIQDYEELMGARLVQIEKQPIEKIISKMKIILSFENESRFKFISPEYMIVSEILKALDLVDMDKQSIQIRYQSMDGKFHDIDLLIQPKDQIQWMINYENSDYAVFPYSHQFENPYAINSYQEEKSLYLQFNTSTISNTSQLLSELNADHLLDHIEKIFIDFRYHQGGDQSLLPVLDPWIADTLKMHSMDIFLLVGRGTFDSGIQEAYLLKSKYQIPVIGEPVGGSLSYFSKVEEIILPESGWKVYCTTEKNELDMDSVEDLSPDISFNRILPHPFMTKEALLKALNQLV